MSLWCIHDTLVLYFPRLTKETQAKHKLSARHVLCRSFARCGHALTSPIQLHSCLDGGPGQHPSRPASLSSLPPACRVIASAEPDVIAPTAPAPC